ncbi:MAG: hypothetical protein ACOX8E_11130 [Ruminococcus sp.]|jgi:hypothetical protein
MSLKKRMFRSNMKILFAAMISLMIIILAVLVFFEDSLENQIYSLSQTKLDSHIGEVVDLMESEDIKSAEDLQRQVGKWEYHTAEIAGGKVISGDQGEKMRELAEFFSVDDKSGRTDIFSYQKATAAGKYLEQRDTYLVAVRFAENNWLVSSLNTSFYVFLAAVIGAGILAIAFLMFLASFFTRRMNRVIMEPVE